MEAEPLTDFREAARELIVARAELDWRSGQFVGGIIYADKPLSDRQARWLTSLLQRAGLPPLADGGAA